MKRVIKTLNLMLCMAVIMFSGIIVTKAAGYDSYKIGDAVIFGEIGGHVFEDSDASSSTVRVFVDGWNKTKSEWDAWWEEYAKTKGKSVEDVIFYNFDWENNIKNKTNFSHTVATIYDLDKFVDVNFIPKKYWGSSTEPITVISNGPVRYESYISGTAEINGINGLSTIIYVIDNKENLPMWMYADNINFYGSAFSDNKDRNLGCDGYDRCYIRSYQYKDNINYEEYLTTGYFNIALTNDFYFGLAPRVLDNGTDDENGWVHQFVSYIPIVTIDKSNIDSVERATKTYKYDNSVGQVITYHNTGVYEESKPNEENKPSEESKPSEEVKPSEETKPEKIDKCKDIEVNKTYKINYITNGGNDLEVETKDSQNVNLQTPNKDGYVFEGWYYDEALSSKATSPLVLKENKNDDGCVTGYSDITLYAKWIKVFASNDVEVSIDENKLDNITALEVNKLDNLEQIDTKFNGIMSNIVAYDISLLDSSNNSVSLNSKVKVSIPLSNIKTDKLSVYMVIDDKSNQINNYEIVDNKVVFVTDKIGTICFGEKVTISNPKTLDNIGIYFVFGICLITSIIFIMKKLTKLKANN